MFAILKLIIWMAGVVTVAYFVLPFIGYELNLQYWQDQKGACQKELQQCQKDLIKGGLEGAKENCTITCVDHKRLIEKIAK